MGRWTQALKQSQETSGLTLVPREIDSSPEIRVVKPPSNTSIIETTYPDRYTKCAYCGAGMWWTESDDYRCGKCGVLWSAGSVTDKTDESHHQVTAVLDLARSYDWGVAVIIGGGWIGSADDEEGRVLRLGEVVGGDESHWRAFADRASERQLQEALDLMEGLAFAA